MKNNWLILTLLSTIFISSCKQQETCDYEAIEPCVEECAMYEDFQDDSLGVATNWESVNASDAQIVEAGSNKYLTVRDLSGASYLYNNTDFPANLIEQGCVLKYDVIYEAGGSGNNLSTDNSIIIYQGSAPQTATLRANFVLNSSSLITNNQPFTTIEVPLELADPSSGALPSNAFGEWRIGSGPPYTAAQINDFNTIIQNISGIAFFLDEGSNPAEIWYFDNFCFQNCCDNKNNPLIEN